MNPKSVCCGVAILLGVLAGCQKQAEAPSVAKAEAPKPVTVTVVKEQERSRSFLAVNQQLELGGTLYGYVDVDGDVLKLTSGLQEVLTQVAAMQPAVEPYVKQDFSAIATKLGLTDIKAAGVSSVPDGTGYFRNRMFFYTPGERHGLLLGLGGKPGPFTHLHLAPADTAFYAEADLDLPVVYRTIKDVVAQVAGEPVGNQMEATLKNAGEAAALSVLDLIYGLKGHSAVVLRIDDEKTMALPGGAVTLPSFSLLLCVDGVGPVVERALQQSPLFKRTDETTHLYEVTQPLPIEGIQPVVLIDGNTLFFATTRAFLDQCRTQKSSLAESDEFRRATAGVGTEGNGITYVHPRAFAALRRIEKLNPSLPPQAQSVLALVLRKVPKADRPMVLVRSNLPDGILIRAYWDRSFKQQVAMISLYNPVTLGLVAAMAIPAFQKVRSSSQEKAVMNNLRQLSAAADQYYLETGFRTASFDALVGKGKYVQRLVPVMGENYRQLRFVQGQPLRLKMPNGKVIEFGD
jgi:hypothetical protein